MKKIYTKQNLEAVVKISISFSDVLIKLNLRTAGGNFRTIKKYITQYGIDTSHFISESIRRSALSQHVLFKKISISNILVLNSTFSRTHLKARLYKEGLKKRECELCGQTEEWHGKKMSLILDHINGVHDDNRIENLRIICPNCNATLDTHAGKNKKQVKKEKIDKRTLNRKIKDRPPIEQLQSEIRMLGFVAVGKKYGVSDNAIRKWLK